MNQDDNFAKHLIHIDDPLKTVPEEGGKTYFPGKLVVLQYPAT